MGAGDSQAIGPRWLRPGIGGLLIATLGFAAFAIGTVHVWTRFVVALAAAVALTLTLVERVLTGRGVPVCTARTHVANAPIAGGAPAASDCVSSAPGQRTSS